MTKEASSPRGWRFARSIAVELDVAAYFVRIGPDALPKGLAELAMAIPPAWFEEFDALGPTATLERGMRTIVERLARWAGVLEVEDYDIASAAMREITVEDAIAQVAAASGLEPNRDLEPAQCLIELEHQLSAELAEMSPLLPASDASIAKRDGDALFVAVGSLRGEPLHGRFWHWIDRFFYEAYRPWRVTRQDAMAGHEKAAIEALGGVEGTGPPKLDWLSATNPLITSSTLQAGAKAGDFDVVFWTEPCGLSDTWAFVPGTLMTSYAERGLLYEYYESMRDDLSTRLKALADPTRMSILRMIRMHDLDNTQLATYLDVSRPTVSQHAKILSDAGVITTTREGRQARHAFHPEAVSRLCDDLLLLLDVPDKRPGG